MRIEDWQKHRIEKRLRLKHGTTFAEICSYIVLKEELEELEAWKRQVRVTGDEIKEWQEKRHPDAPKSLRDNPAWLAQTAVANILQDKEKALRKEMDVKRPQRMAEAGKLVEQYLEQTYGEPYFDDEGTLKGWGTQLKVIRRDHIKKTADIAMPYKDRALKAVKR